MLQGRASNPERVRRARWGAAGEGLKSSVELRLEAPVDPTGKGKEESFLSIEVHKPSQEYLHEIRSRNSRNNSRSVKQFSSPKSRDRPAPDWNYAYFGRCGVDS